MKKPFAFAVGFFFLVPSVFAFNKDAFAVHLRKALGLDTRTEIKVLSEPVPAGFGDLMMVNTTLGGAPYPVYITKDEKKYIWGFVVDYSIDPDKTREQSISLKKVHSQGNATAPVTVVEYSDLQCSHCKAAHVSLKQELFKNYTPEQVRFVFKHFPLSGHDWAEPAAAAAECAAQQKESTFWDATNYFFDNQEKITKDNVSDKIQDFVKTAKLNKSAFDACLKVPSTLERVRADKKEGAAIGVNSTPAIFINGRARRGYRDFEDIRVVIDEKLKDVKN